MQEMNTIQVDCCKKMFIETKINKNPNNKQEVNMIEVVNPSSS
jgi:hypothetical protein